jgi:hypothetical protein
MDVPVVRILSVVDALREALTTGPDGAMEDHIVGARVGECGHYHHPRTDSVDIEIYRVDDASGVRVVIALALPVGSVPDPAV